MPQVCAVPVVVRAVARGEFANHGDRCSPNRRVPRPRPPMPGQTVCPQRQYGVSQGSRRSERSQTNVRASAADRAPRYVTEELQRAARSCQCERAVRRVPSVSGFGLSKVRCSGRGPVWTV
jgi:hypothetical protein